MAGSRRVIIQPLQECRFELDPSESISVRLVDGAAEVFGYELALHSEYPFGDEARFAVFTWTGATVEISL